MKNRGSACTSAARAAWVIRACAKAVICALACLAFLAPPAFAGQFDISTYAGTGVNGEAGDGGPATAAQLRSPLGMAIAPNGDMYVADYGADKVRKISAAGVITLFAGTGASGSTGDGGLATLAKLHQPADVAIDAAGNVYIADSANAKVRMVTPGGIISTFAGTGVAGNSGDGGAATSAKLTTPMGLQFDSAGNLYVADFGANTIRKITPGGTISTVAGTGSAGSTGDGGPATSATLNGPADVAFDSAGNMYIAGYTSSRIRKVAILTGTISTFAGTGTAGDTGDGGAATAAQINMPWGVSVDPGDNVYITEIGGNVIRKVTPLGVISKVAGTGVGGFSGDGGPALSAQLFTPAKVEFTANGDGFVPDYSNHRVRKIETLAVPVAPTPSGFSPASPANNNAPAVTGTAPAGTTVKLYTNSSCTSALAGTGSASTFGGSGISVSVADDSTTTFYATATGGSLTSPCSATSATYVEDSTPPVAPTITTPPTSPGTGRSPSWSFSGEAGAAFQCRLDQGGTQIQGWAACTSAKSYSLSGQPDGTYTFSVKQTDAAGNAGTLAATSDYTLDTTPPAVPTISSPPPANTNNPSVSWAFSSDLGASFDCRLEKAGSPVFDWATCSSPKGYSLAVQSDGTYTFLVRARDALGNTSTNASSSFTLDRVAPSNPSLTSSPGAIGHDDHPSWSFTGDAGATFMCKIDRGATPIVGWASCSGSKSYDLSGEIDGTYTFSVRSLDTAGNASGVVTSDYTLDRVNPAAPAITSTPAPTSGRSPSWSFTGEGSATFQCQLDRGGTVISAWAPCSSPKGFSIGAGEPDGVYTFSVQQTDAAGNTGSVATSNYTLDTQAPAPPTITSPPAGPSNNASPSWGFSGELGATLQCRLEKSGAVVSDWATCTSPQGYSLAAQTDGTFTFLVRARDVAGNTGSPASSNYTIDRAAPGLPTLTGTPGATGNDVHPSWSFTAEAGSTTECRLDIGGTQIDDWNPCSGAKSYDLSAAVDGTYTFSVRATDAAGNQSSMRTSDYLLDTQKPNPPSITSAPPSPGNGTAPTWSFNAELGALVECRITRGATTVSNWAACSGSQLYNLSAQVDGTYTFAVRATDAAGNQSDPSTSDYTLDRVGPAAPSIDSAPSTPGNVTNPAWSFSSEPLAGFKCRLTRGGTVVSNWATCVSGSPYDLSNEADGTYTFEVQATDQAGNQGAIASSNYALDTVPPAVPTITSSPPSPGNDPTPTWHFTAPGGTPECRVTQGATVISGWSDCASPFSSNLSSQPDGTYVFSVRARDTAGNRSAAATSSFVLDTSVPLTPSIDTVPGPVGSGRSPSWAFSGGGGETFECLLERGATTVLGWTACASPQPYSLAGLVDGIYTFSVRGVAAGGTRGAAVTDTYTLDTAAPAAPNITATPPATGNAHSATWSFDAESGALVECQLERDTSLVQGWTACSSPLTESLSGLPDGVYKLSVRATDAALNIGPAATSTYALDTVAPPAPSVTGPAASPANDAQPSFSFSAAGAAAFECRLDGGSGAAGAWQPCTTPRAFDLSREPDGTYTFSVRATDTAGNTGAPTVVSYELDRAGADTRIDTSPGAIGNTRTPSWAFSAEAGATFQCSLSTLSAPVFALAACTNPRQYDLASQPDGVYVFSVRATDRAGNAGAPVENRYELDTVPPAKPTIKTSPATPDRDRTPTWSLGVDTGATLECRTMFGKTTVFDWAACTSPKTVDLRQQGEGAYKLYVRARDAAGNYSAQVNDDYQLDLTPPDPPDVVEAASTTADDPSPTWKFSGESGATFECQLKNGDTVVEKWAPCESPKTYNLSGEPAGTYTFSVRQTDEAGNESDMGSARYVLSAAAADPGNSGSGGGGNGGGGSPPSSPTPATPTPTPTTDPSQPPAGGPADPKAADKAAPGKDKSKLPAAPAKPGAAQTGPGAPGARPDAGGGGSGSSSDASGGHHKHHAKKRHGADAAVHALTGAVGAAAQVIAKNADKSVFPFSLVVIVFLFLGIQGRIDRSDPKLALAPLNADPDLEFDPPPTHK